MSDPAWDIGDPNNPETSPMLRRSLRYGISVDQGVGFSETSGYGWPTPEVGIGPQSIIDDNGLARSLVLDAVTGHFYDISCRLGPDNSGIERVRKDREGISKTISGITLTPGAVVSVTATGHGFATGDSVEFRGVGGTTELNETAFTITKSTDDIFTLDGTDGSDYTAWTSGGKAFKAGIEISPAIELGEDVAQSESMLLRRQKLYLFTRPEDETRRSDNGFDSNGYPSGITFKDEVFVDGEQSTATATADEIAIPKHQITYDKHVEGNRIWDRLTASKGAHSIIETHAKYVSTDIPDGPDNMITTEQGYQAELAEPQHWFGMSNGSPIDRATGGSLSITGTAVTGPDGNTESALQITAAVTLDTASLSAGTLLVWYTGTIAVTIGGSSVSLTAVGTSGSWTMAYATGITKTGALVITPTGTAKIFDVRTFDGSTISSGCRTYIKNDIVNNNGKIVLP